MPSYLTGNDGSITFPNAHGAQFNTWNATFARNVSDITGYGDTGRRRQLGIWDVSGSAGGFLEFDAANTSPGVADMAEDGAAVVLIARAANTNIAGQGACSYSLTAVISDIAITSTKTGDAAVSFNFSIANGTIPTETWDETP
jgi:hypothetical protein